MVRSFRNAWKCMANGFSICPGINKVIMVNENIEKLHLNFDDMRLRNKFAVHVFTKILNPCFFLIQLCCL